MPPHAHTCNSSAICSICTDLLIGAKGTHQQALQIVVARCGHAYHEPCLDQSLITGKFCPVCSAVIVLDFRGKPDTRRVIVTEDSSAISSGDITGVPACVVEKLRREHAMEVSAEKAKVSGLKADAAREREKTGKLGVKVESMRAQVEGIERERDVWFREKNELEAKISDLHQENARLRRDVGPKRNVKIADHQADGDVPAMRRELDERRKTEEDTHKELQALNAELDEWRKSLTSSKGERPHSVVTGSAELNRGVKRAASDDDGTPALSHRAEQGRERPKKRLRLSRDGEGSLGGVSVTAVMNRVQVADAAAVGAQAEDAEDSVLDAVDEVTIPRRSLPQARSPQEPERRSQTSWISWLTGGLTI